MLVILGLTGMGTAMAAIRDGANDNERVFETGIACVIATVGVLPFCKRADYSDSRSESLLGMTIVMLMFGTSLLLIRDLSTVGLDLMWNGESG